MSWLCFYWTTFGKFMSGERGKHLNSIFGPLCYFVFWGWLVCGHQCTLSKSMLNSAKTYKYLEATYRLSYESLMGYIRSGKFISCEQTDVCVYSNHPFYKTLSITIKRPNITSKGHIDQEEKNNCESSRKRKPTFNWMFDSSGNGIQGKGLGKCSGPLQWKLLFRHSTKKFLKFKKFDI